MNAFMHTVKGKVSQKMEKYIVHTFFQLCKIYSCDHKGKLGTLKGPGLLFKPGDPGQTKIKKKEEGSDSELMVLREVYASMEFNPQAAVPPGEFELHMDKGSAFTFQTTVDIKETVTENVMRTTFVKMVQNMQNSLNTPLQYTYSRGRPLQTYLEPNYNFKLPIFVEGGREGHSTLKIPGKDLLTKVALNDFSIFADNIKIKEVMFEKNNIFGFPEKIFVSDLGMAKTLDFRMEKILNNLKIGFFLDSGSNRIFIENTRIVNGSLLCVIGPNFANFDYVNKLESGQSLQRLNITPKLLQSYSMAEIKNLHFEVNLVIEISW